VRLLLDTHALIWWLAGNTSISLRARRSIEAASEVFVSAATAWEVATKFRLGKLPEAERLAKNYAVEVASQGFLGLAITVDHGLLAGRLAGAFDAFGVDRLW
jgi:PIN domain nuclease of toxin-antitoxin system